jgi:hypothetical protein
MIASITRIQSPLNFSPKSNLGLLLSSPNIWTVTHFQMVCLLLLCHETKIYYKIFLQGHISVCSVLNIYGMNANQTLAQRPRATHAMCKWRHRGYCGRVGVMWTALSVGDPTVWPCKGDLERGRRKPSLIGRLTALQRTRLCSVNLTPWSESASELYRPSDRRLSTK